MTHLNTAQDYKGSLGSQLACRRLVGSAYVHTGVWFGKVRYWTSGLLLDISLQFYLAEALSFLSLKAAFEWSW